MNDSILTKLGKNGDVFLAVGVIAIIAVMIIPIPTFLLDILLSANITVAIVLLMVSMYLSKPLDLSVFPSLLLILTLFRLALNVATTRLILGEGFAGEVVSAFGAFVVGGNYVVGFIIFIILVIIQFVVIVKGSGRISEVSARFTLDAMPGKQMAIDADLNAGMITEEVARHRRDVIAREAEFFGAMDGASKFVKGDAVAGLIINGVNILGGFIIGVAQRDMSFTDALSNYTLLTIGDGLVSQIPALIISIASGMVVTRSGSGSTLDVELRQQLFGKPKVLMIAAGALFAFAIIPGMPTIPFLVLSALVGGIGFATNTQQKKEAAIASIPPPAKPVEVVEEKVEKYLQVDPLELEIGYGLIPLVDESQGGDLFRRITNIRKQLALELGVLVPPIRVRDNLQLAPNQYVVKVRGNVLATDELYPELYLAMNSGMATGDLEGIQTKDPAFLQPAVWVTAAERERAEIQGYTVVESAAVLATHLQEELKKNADKILGRQDVKVLLENLKKEYPAVVEELTNDLLPIGSVQKVLQNLLREGIPIRDLVSIVESLVDYARVTKNVDVLTEYVRHSLSDTIARLYQDQNGVIHAISIDPDFEELVTDSLKKNRDVGSTLGLPPAVIQTIHHNLASSIDQALGYGYQPLLVVAATVRPYLYRLLHTAFPSLVILSFTELPPETEIEFIGQVELLEPQ
ncbi:MAG TPA: flagellar biosynthesis protein FlhA [Bacteroidota bacterium]|nr:flagellar biosynthesis protein FlhA [Bacteroidota bacterium]